MNRREVLIDAALMVVAEAGLKNLTHRAVDTRAGLPAGSTGNVFPNRAGLIEALLTELEHRDLGAFDVEAALRVRSVREIAELLTRGIETMLSPEKSPLTRVRLTMMQAYPNETQAVHQRLLAFLESLLIGCGVDNPQARARLVAAFLDGVMLHELTVADPPLDPALLTRSIERLLAS